MTSEGRDYEGLRQEQTPLILVTGPWTRLPECASAARKPGGVAVYGQSCRWNAIVLSFGKLRLSRA